MNHERRSPIRKIAGWLLILCGGIGLSGSLSLLYMLLMGQVKPGESYFLGDLTPSVGDVLVSMGIQLTLVAVGLALLPAKSMADNDRERTCN